MVGANLHNAKIISKQLKRYFTMISVHFVKFRLFTLISIHFVKFRIFTLISIHFVEFPIFTLILTHFIKFRINTSVSIHITRKKCDHASHIYFITNNSSQVLKSIIQAPFLVAYSLQSLRKNVSVFGVFLVHIFQPLGRVRRFTLHPAGIYLLKVNNRSTRTSCKIC